MQCIRSGMRSVLIATLLAAVVAGCRDSQPAGSANPPQSGPAPYSVRCVVRVFAREGISLHSVNPALGKRGWVPLQPDSRNLIIEVTVAATARGAHVLLTQA